MKWQCWQKTEAWGGIEVVSEVVPFPYRTLGEREHNEVEISLSDDQLDSEDPQVNVYLFGQADFNIQLYSLRGLANAISTSTDRLFATLARMGLSEEQVIERLVRQRQSA